MPRPSPSPEGVFARDLSPTPTNILAGSSRSPSPSRYRQSSPVVGGSLQQELAPFLHQAAATSSSPSPEPVNLTPHPADPSPEPEPELSPGIYQVYQSQTRSHDSTENLANIQGRDDLRLSSEAPSLEWEEDFPDTEQAVRNLHEANLSGPSDSVEKEAEVEEKTQVADEESKDISESNESSCTCSTEGPRSDCLQCSNISKYRVSLTEFVEPDPGSRDLIGQEGERTRRRLKHQIGFRTRPELVVREFSLHRNLELVSCLDIIPREVGLDTQDWRCIDCTKAIGALFGNGRVCAFTKQHYCEDCHGGDELAVIPARLLFNWDGKPYPVAKSSLRFIQAIRSEPIIHLRSFNPSLSTFVPTVEAAKKKRKKLTYLSAYLTACPRATESHLPAELLVMLRNREYLITDTDTYSILDLEELWRGELTEVLRRAVLYCLAHVDACLICAGRGFICEICQDKRPVYPFNLDASSQCEQCCTVFHAKCTLTVQQCPRCERLASRSLNQLISQTRLDRQLGPAAAS